MCVSGSSFFIAELCFLCLFVHILVTLGCWFGAIMDKAAVDNGLSKNLGEFSPGSSPESPLVSQQLRAVVWRVLGLGPQGKDTPTKQSKSSIRETREP